MDAARRLRRDPALAHEYELEQLGDPATQLHEQRLGQTLDTTEQWLAAARTPWRFSGCPNNAGLPSELLAPHDLQNATALYNAASSAGSVWDARRDLVSGRSQSWRPAPDTPTE